MALRGDPPKGETAFVPAPDGLKHASELVSLIRENYGDAQLIGVGGYRKNIPNPRRGNGFALLERKSRLRRRFRDDPDVL